MSYDYRAVHSRHLESIVTYSLRLFMFPCAGMFENADKCCREHDHCVHIIPSFTVNYGTFNTNLFIVSHCDCDRR